ncbi:RNA polymerase sigma factor [Pseudomonas sp. Os17]|uniref:sigma-70 family RNA polymerase sigma factor n=1 Tax=Pseudomonas TaxID=286 RepID=UPI0005FCA32C|nr:MULTISPECIES: sigma-70 family RNA polymerase sigma factor [Pseudomonas]RXU65338.1 RNA polymerase subunit sigma [Pseudomonas protegens]BAQ74439.1 RNA polymerase sigma factor [Pseudomonas sp. Os17]
MSLPESLFDHAGCIAACARGERQALEALYHEEGPRLLGVARRLVRDTALAEDILHDAFIRIWQGASSFDPERGSARGWMFSITRHLALNFLRRHGREVPIDEPYPEYPQALDVLAMSTAPATALADAGRLEHCLGQLPSQRRECLLQAYVDGYSHGEIAARMATPLGTVKAWIKRSLSALRECLG